MSKAYEIMEDMAFKLKSEALYLKLKELIDDRIDGIIKIYERGIGKTYNLSRLSEEYRIPMIVCTPMGKRLILQRKEFNPFVIYQDEIKEYYFNEKIALIDEEHLINPDNLKYLKDKEIILIGCDTKIY